MDASERYDVVVATDCRLPGGTTASVAEEVTAQARAGYRTALLHVPSTLSATSRPFSPRLAELVATGRCDVITGRSFACSLLVVRHPRVAAELQAGSLPSPDADHVVLIANQAAGGPGGGTEHYDPAEATTRLQAWAGVEPRWIPIGPLVRRNLRSVAPDLELADDDWVNILDARAWSAPHEAPVGDVIRIGRHSRDHRLKWPPNADDLLAAYPSAPDLEVHVLGGASVARNLMPSAQLPDNWYVRPFGAVSPRTFLADIDFFVYHHHPDWVEAFGRTIIEAMASGAVAILPPHFEELFGDAAVYTPVSGTPETVRRLAADPEAYRASSERGQRLVRQRFSHAAHIGRIEAIIGPPGDAPAPSAPGPGTSHRRVLLVSSNGAGVGHLMRLMAIARRLPSDVEPVFLTLSQAVGVVRELGFHVEYLPSRGALDAPHGLWHKLLEARVLELIDTLELSAVVFDGTWPYNGMLDALAQRPLVRGVWSRRAMWREEVTRHVLHLAPRFDLILEPGELATEDDRGATSHLRHEVEQVGPIAFLRLDEPVDRTAARSELGLPAEGTIALVQLGAGNINDTSSLLGSVVEELQAADPSLTICVTRSAIGGGEMLPSGVRTISAYPLARYLAAFDLAVAASGYNTFHELMLAELPTVFVPNTQTATDDQLGRARWAERQGAGHCVLEGDTASLRAALASLTDEPKRRAVQERLASLTAEDGAEQAAAALVELLATPPSRERIRQPPSRAPSRSRHERFVRSARRVVASLPDPVRFGLVRAFNRLRRRPGSGPPPRPEQSGGAIGLVPLGHSWDESIAAGDPRLTALLLPDDATDADIEQVVADAAMLQRTTGAFVPFFVTGSSHLQPFRDHGYGVEVLPTREGLVRLVGEEEAAEARLRRLREIRRRYAIDEVLAIGEPTATRGLLAGITTTPTARPADQ